MGDREHYDGETFFPIDATGGSVPDLAAAPAHRRRTRRVGLAAAALALVVGGTVGGFAVNTLSGESREPGFGTVTSQAFTGGQEEPNDPAPAPAPQPRPGAEGGGGEAD